MYNVLTIKIDCEYYSHMKLKYNLGVFLYGFANKRSANFLDLAANKLNKDLKYFNDSSSIREILLDYFSGKDTLEKLCKNKIGNLSNVVLFLMK